MQNNAQQSISLARGPSTYLKITIGFQDHSILPVGAGRNGEWFGSVLPRPTGFFLALTI